MQIHGFDHFNIRCRPAEVSALVAFYKDLLGLAEGRRPNFPFPGAWLYLGDQPVVHISARLPDDSPPPPPGPFDHISFRTRGLEALRARLNSAGLAFEEAPVPGFPLHQIFLRDPAGAKVEFTFTVPERD